MNFGAKYYRCDFQVHTPRDQQFVGKEYVKDAERKAYSDAFIASCREKKVDAVAITDHHDLVFFKYIRQASLDEVLPGPSVERIIVFPGIELTLDVPCQALLIFDSNLNLSDETIIKIYTTLGIENHNNDSDSKAASHSRLPIKAINDVYDRLNKVSELKNRFVVLPNVKENGGDSILRLGMHNEYAKGIFLGGYLDRGQYKGHMTKVGWNNIVLGKTSAYGNREIAIFQTSDNRTDTFEHLGVSTTWVKWSMPTAEGLRQACLAKNSRISQQDPVLPTTRITYFKLTGGNFLKNLDINFNPQFNVAIGGRGTGKSSLLQYLSWVLGKDADGEKKNSLQDFVANTLSTGTVEVAILKNNIPHLLKRSISKYEIKIGDDNWQETNSGNVTAIIRSDSFSQKELSRYQKNKTAQLSKIIENSITTSLDSLTRKLTENSFEIKEISATFESFIENEQTSANLKAQIESLEEQIKSLNDQLNAVPSADQIIIKNNSLVDKEKALISQSQNQIHQIVSQINAIISKGNFELMEVDHGGVLNNELTRKLKLAHNDVLVYMQALLANVVKNSASHELNSTVSDLKWAHLDFDAEYLAAAGRQRLFEGIIKELEELRSLLVVLKKDRIRVLDKVSQEKGVVRELQRLFFDRNNLNLEHYKLISGAVAQVSGQSDGSLTIELSDLSNISTIVKDFSDFVTGSKGQPQRTQAFFDKLKDGNKTYKKLLKFWLSIYKAKKTGENVERLFSAYDLVNTSFLDTDFERIIESFNTSSILDFAMMLPSYELKLWYQKDAVTKIPFEDASYGQQAGAILTILLNQEFGPLIIDQPEDDLDNKVIHQITENIISAKHKRQLIFSSHNANIAVNGDAELIIAFDHNSDKSSGEVVESGSIDRYEIKEKVKDIMEGGNKAFEMRKTKYGF